MRALRSIQSSDKYPLQTTITGNHFHEIGVTGKQTSALFSATSCRTTFRGNVAYNGPRAGVRPRSFPRPHAVSFVLLHTVHGDGMAKLFVLSDRAVVVWLVVGRST